LRFASESTGPHLLIHTAFDNILRRPRNVEVLP
jgi:hypothetical protein